MTEIRHGTYAGWNQHRKQGVPMCDACRWANRDYHRRHRARGADRWVNEHLGTCVRGLGWPRQSVTLP